MTDPRRLVDGQGTGLGLALLRAAQDEPLPERVMKKTIMAVGASTVIATTAGAAAAASGASAGAATKATAGIGIAWAAKWVGMGVLAGTVTVGATVQVQGVLSHRSAAPVVSTSGSQVGPRTGGVWGGASSVAMEIPEPSTAPPNSSASGERLPGFFLAQGPTPPQWNEGLSDVLTQANPTALVVSSALAPPTAASGGNAPAALLAAEVALLDQARAALVAGHSGMALALLDRHAREFPRGRLTPEAFLVRIEALAKSGRRAAARQVAEDFLARNPGSPDADYIRRLLGDDGL